MARIVPAGATAGTGAGAAAGGAFCAIAGTADMPAIIVVANRATTTGRCLLLLIIAVTRSTFYKKATYRSRREKRREIASSCPIRLSRSSRRSEEHTSELQSLMRISYDVFCL